MILWINACVRQDSRTLRLTKHLLAGFDDTVTEIRLSDAHFPRVDEAYLAERVGF